MAKTADVIVIGGGIIGCSIAYYLSKARIGVTVLEKEQVGYAGATYASAGMLAPLSDAFEPGPMLDLALRSFRMFPDLIGEVESDSGMKVEYRPTGILRLALDEKEEKELRQRLQRQKGSGLKVEWVTPEDVVKLEPQASRASLGALFSPDEHQLSAPRLAEALKWAAVRHGAKFCENTPVTGLRRNGSRVTGVHTFDGELSAGTTIVANGSWSCIAGQWLNVKLPVQPVRGQVLFLTGLPPLHYSVFGDHTYALTKGDLILAGTTAEHAGFDQRVTVQGVVKILQGIQQVIPGASNASIHHGRAGFRPWTPDGLPLLGPVDGLAGVLIASGHYRSGILMAPVTGKLMADLVAGPPRQKILAPFSPSRFQ